MSKITKQVITTIEICKCDICGKEDDCMETCISCGADICAEHSEYWGGTCVYLHEEGMYCDKCSVGKKTVTKFDMEER